MLKKLILFFCSIFWVVTASASTHLNADKTYLTLTNNTNENISIHTTLTTSDTHFSRGKDWDETSLTLAPYESKQVLWLNRNIDVLANQMYQFDVIANRPNFPNDNVTITLL